ncbi:MAG: glycosyl hydrolase-related protein [Firmicutes bacterium]|nr:glycosyl hydrolase-related protein [Bacillota bacterium]
MVLQVIVVPHSHIDTEWYWTYDTTIQWSREIVQQALTRIAQDPRYHFSQDQVSVMAPVWNQMADDERTAWREAVARGQWEPLLGFFTSSELAEPSGESLVRQILYGQAWTQAQLGQAARIAWLIDQFGQIPQLPQILTQAGYQGYVFCRDLPLDRDITQFPADFWYQGPDGSRLLTHWLTTVGYCVGPETLADRLPTLQHHSHQNLWLIPWGCDVVRPEMSAAEVLDFVSQAVHQIVPDAVVSLGTPSQYFDRLGEQADALPTVDWDFNPPRRRGDLRGTFDNRYRFKVWHRQVEEMLVATETLAATLGVPLGEHWMRNWELLLLSEFHDTMGGSCSDTVFERAMERLTGAAQDAQCRQTQYLGGLGLDEAVPVFNPRLQWGCEVITLLPGDATGAWIGQDGDGNLLPSRQVAPGSPVECVLKLPGLSVGSVRVVRGSESTVERTWLTREDSEVIVKTTQYTACIQPREGTLSWVQTPDGQRLWETEDRANSVEFWHETDPDLEGTLTLNGHRELLSAPPDECWVERSALGYTLRIGRPALGGRLRQTFRLYDHTPRIDCDLELEGVVPPDGLLVVRFPRRGGTHSGIWYETPFALTPRPEGHFAAHTFAASGDREGLAVLNRGTPGYWFEPTAWYLVWLRAIGDYTRYRTSATTARKVGPFPEMLRHVVTEYSGGKTGTSLAREVGDHHLQYALLPFFSSLRESRVAETGQAWNRPFVVGPSSGVAGFRATHEGPPITLSGLPVLLDAFKEAEDGQGWILRFHEPYGQSGSLTCLLGSRFQGARRVDLRERALAPVEQGPTVTMAVTPFQIQTWRLIDRGSGQ